MLEQEQNLEIVSFEETSQKIKGIMAEHELQRVSSLRPSSALEIKVQRHVTFNRWTTALKEGVELDVANRIAGTKPK